MAGINRIVEIIPAIVLVIALLYSNKKHTKHLRIRTAILYIILLIVIVYYWRINNLYGMVVLLLCTLYINETIQVKKEGLDYESLPINSEDKSNYLKGVDVVYWINLDRSTKRRADMNELLEDPAFTKYKIKTVRIPAVDGADIKNINALLETPLPANKTDNLNVYGCILSHMNTIKQFSESNNKIALILEDDATLEYKQYWRQSIRTIIGNAPSDWEIIQLGLIPGSGYSVQNAKMFEPHVTRLQWSTIAYLINRDGAQKFIRNHCSNTGKYSFDPSYTDHHTADIYLYDKIRTYTYKYPYFTYPKDNISEISEEASQHHIYPKQVCDDVMYNRSSDLYKNAEMVISRYAEDLAWLNNYPYNKLSYIVYNKGDDDKFVKTPNATAILNVKNVGRCDHTYLYHIVQNYDNLKDVTIFLPGSVEMTYKNIRASAIIESVDSEPKSTMVVHYYPDVKTVLENFELTDYGSTNSTNLLKNNESKLHPANPRPFGKWYANTFGDLKINYVSYLGIMAVSKKHIHNRPKEFYENLMKQLETHSNPEVGHYFERAWVAVFHPMDDLKFV